MRDKSLFRRGAIGIVSLWLVSLALAPNLLVLGASFLRRGTVDYFDFTFTLDNYSRLFDPTVAAVFADSIVLALGTTLICLALGYPFAYIMARVDKRYRGVLLLLVIIPFWTNSLIRTYALITIISANGLLNSLLLWLGLIENPLQIMYTRTAVFIGLTYTLLPFMILPLYASIEKLDTRLLEASRDLGANALQTFTRVSLPLTVPGILAGCMLVFLPALGLFYIPDILGGAKDLILGNYIKDQFLSARDWPFGSAISVMLTAIMALLLLLYWRDAEKANRRSGRGRGGGPSAAPPEIEHGGAL